MPKLVCSLTTIFSLPFLAAAAANAQNSLRSDGIESCLECDATGGSYTGACGSFCTVCRGLCRLSLVVDVGAREFVAQASDGSVFILQVPRSLLHSLLQVNPEAAMLLAVLDARSKTVDALPPIRGDGGSDRAMSVRSVIMFLEGDHDEDRVRSASTPLPPSAVQSQVTWEFEKIKDSAELRISHRFLNNREEVVAQTYKDLMVSLRWMPASKGNAGYWLAQSWRERP